MKPGFGGVWCERKALRHLPLKPLASKRKMEFHVMNLFRNVLDTCCKEAQCENASQFAARALDGALEYVITGQCTTSAFPLFLDVIARVTTGRSGEQDTVGASSGLDFLTEFSHGKVFSAMSDVVAERLATGGTNE